MVALSWCACKGDDDESQKALKAVENEPKVLDLLADLLESERERENM